MDQQKKNLLRLTDQIRTRVLEQRKRSLFDLTSRIQTLHVQLDRLLGLQRRLTVCRNHNFTGTAETLRTELRYVVGSLQDELQSIHLQLDRPLPDVPEYRSIWLELVQIGQEFECWDYDLKNQVLSVTTEIVELEEVYLGAFRIELMLNMLGTPSRWPAYKVIACDPQPAQGNESITHPHVNDERLCEGDAVAAIRSALLQGRLCDFFILVHQVIQTYNPHSPYVSLNQWGGKVCGDCGYVTNDDNCYGCDRCGDYFCDGCIRTCHCCEESVCGNCSTNCPECEEAVCPRCQRQCADCGKTVCHQCIEEDLCPTCRDQQEEDNHEDQEPSTTECSPIADSQDVVQPTAA